MPQKKKTYERVIFTPEVIKQVVDEITSTLPEKARELGLGDFWIRLYGGEKWEHDTDEEFFADYRVVYQFEIKEAISSTVQIWSLAPAAIAGVIG